MKKELVVLFIFLMPLIAKAQKTLTLQECYDLANKNYPLAKQTDLLKQKITFEIDAVNKAKLPKLDLNSQATYQSDVTGLPIALPGVTSLNKDQYRATFDINQMIYDGGAIDANVKLKQAQSKTQQQQIEVSLYQLKSRINQYYFQILLLQEKQSLLLSKKELLLSKVQEVKSGVKFGAILPASELVLQAEMLKINQQLTEIKFENKKILQSLSELTKTEIDSETVVLQPDFTSASNEVVRPEISLYNLQSQQLDLSKNIISKSKLPRINAFGAAGYGNPGLNMLDNSFQFFYIVGLKANWNIFDWGKNKKEISALNIAKGLVQSEKETFELNNKIELQQLDDDIKKIEEFLVSDIEIIDTREKIVKSANAQMKNGVITASEYLTEFVNLFEAKNILKTHEVQLSFAKSNYAIAKGN